MTKASKEQKQEYESRLIIFANKHGYGVELDANTYEIDREVDDDGNDIEDEGDPEKKGPAGICHTNQEGGGMIYVREGKGLNGRISTLIHELVHALGFHGYNFNNFGPFGVAWVEWIAESVTQEVTQRIGVDRTEQTARRVAAYGFPGYLDHPVVHKMSDYIYEGVTS